MTKWPQKQTLYLDLRIITIKGGVNKFIYPKKDQKHPYLQGRVANTVWQPLIEQENGGLTNIIYLYLWIEE